MSSDIVHRMPPPPLMPLQPAGATPASSWEPFYVARPPQPVVLVPKLDPTNGEQISLVEGDDPTYRAIATEFRTLLGSGLAVQTIGQKLNKILKNDESAPFEIRFEVDRILAPYLSKRLIRVDALKIDAGPEFKSRASIMLVYTILKTGEQRVMKVEVVQ